MLTPQTGHPSRLLKGSSWRRQMVVVPTRKRMCVNIIHTVGRFRLQFGPIKVETTLDATVWELGVSKLRNVETVHGRVEHPLNTMRCMAQCFDKTVDFPTRVDSSVHFLQQETTMGLMIVVMHEVAVTIALSDF